MEVRVENSFNPAIGVMVTNVKWRLPRAVLVIALLAMVNAANGLSSTSERGEFTVRNYRR